MAQASDPRWDSFSDLNNYAFSTQFEEDFGLNGIFDERLIQYDHPVPPVVTMGMDLLPQTGILPEVSEDLTTSSIAGFSNDTDHSHADTQLDTRSDAALTDAHNAPSLSWFPPDRDPKFNRAWPPAPVLEGPSYQHNSISLRFPNRVSESLPRDVQPTLCVGGHSEIVFRREIEPILDPQFDLGRETFLRKRLVAKGYDPEATENLILAQNPPEVDSSVLDHPFFAAAEDLIDSGADHDTMTTVAQPVIPAATHALKSQFGLVLGKRRKSPKQAFSNCNTIEEESALPDSKRWKKSPIITSAANQSATSEAQVYFSQSGTEEPIVYSENNNPNLASVLPKWSCAFWRFGNKKNEQAHTGINMPGNMNILNCIDNTRCPHCQVALQRLPKNIGECLPNLEDIVFLATGSLIQFMDHLRRDAMFMSVSDRVAFAEQHLTLVCHFEPLRPGHAPNQFSNRNIPIGLEYYATKAEGFVGDFYYVLEPTSMHNFMRNFAIGVLPPDLQNTNNGAIHLATQFVSWYGILSDLDNNRIYQASNVSTEEAKHCLQIILYSSIIALEDVLQAISLNINGPTIDRRQATASLCAICIIYRFLNRRQKRLANKSCTLPTGFARTIHDFEIHVKKQTLRLLPILQKFKNHYGPYFCHMERLETLTPYTNLIASQSKLEPLVNITIERSASWGPLGFVPDIFSARSFSQVLNATGSALEEHLDKLTAQTTSEPRIRMPQLPEPSCELTTASLQQLQLELQYYYSSAQLERAVDWKRRGGTEADSDLMQVTIERIERDVAMSIEEFAGVDTLWNFDVFSATERRTCV